MLSLQSDTTLQLLQTITLSNEVRVLFAHPKPGHVTELRLTDHGRYTQSGTGLFLQEKSTILVVEGIDQYDLWGYTR